MEFDPWVFYVGDPWVFYVGDPWVFYVGPVDTFRISLISLQLRIFISSPGNKMN